MGDGADLALEEMEDDEEAREDFRHGQMSDEEAYERGIIDELGYEIDEGIKVNIKKTKK